MTALQMATAECANYKKGVCLGVDIDDTLQIKMMPCSNSPCLLAEDKRCLYFENMVAPLAAYSQDPTKSKGYLQAVEGYRKGHEQGEIYGRRKCKCGAELGPRRRLCPKCRQLNRRESFKLADAARRAVCLPTVNPI